MLLKSVRECVRVGPNDLEVIGEGEEQEEARADEVRGQGATSPADPAEPHQ